VYALAAPAAGACGSALMGHALMAIAAVTVTASIIVCPRLF
jgi:hypothetical protein